MFLLASLKSNVLPFDNQQASADMDIPSPRIGLFFGAGELHIYTSKGFFWGGKKRYWFFIDVLFPLD